jgi:HK97 family phage major capsid protein
MELEELLAKITELTNAVKENKGTDGLNKEALVADLKSLMEEYNQKLIAAMPQRRGEETEIRTGEVKGKFGGVVKEIGKHGRGRFNGVEVKAVDLILAKHLLDRANALRRDGKSFDGVDKLRPVSEDLAAAVKAMTSTGSGTGDELVPTNIAAEIWNDFYAQSKVFADLPEQPMASDPQQISMVSGLTFRKGTQNTASTATDSATSSSLLTATEQVAEVNWSYDLDEDAVIAMMPLFRQMAARDGAEQMDAFALNADATNASTGNINLDDDDPADDSYYLTAGQDGLRHQFLVDNTGQGSNVNAAIGDAGIATILAKMGKYALDYVNCRIVPDIQTYLTMLTMTNVATVDKYGPSATVLTGELAKYRGIPIIPSASMPLTEADGKACKTAGSNTKGQLVAYNRLMWRRGSRRGLTIEVDRLIQKRQLVMVVSFRIAVGAWGTRSTAKHTAGGYGITV